MLAKTASARPIPVSDKYINYVDSWSAAGDLNIQSLPLRAVDGMPGDMYIRTLYDKIIDARYYRLTDRQSIAAGTTVTKGTYQFFALPRNDRTQTTLDGSITLTKKGVDFTNMVKAGELSGGYTLITDSLQACVFIPHRDFGAFTANAAAMPSTAAAAAADTSSATNHLLALCLNTYLTFSEPDHGNFAEGNLLDFPSDRVINGCFGGATPEGFVQIGVGVPEYLRQIRVLQDNHHFDVTLEFFRDTTFVSSVVLDMALCGLLFIQ